MKVISEILRDSNYNLTLFDGDEVQWLHNRIYEKDVKGKKAYFVECVRRAKPILLKPEEIVRQIYTYRLITKYNYPVERIKFEHPIYFGREPKAADIVIFDKDRPTTEYIIIEVKKPKLLDGKKQLRSYCNATGAPMGVWSNGGAISYYNRKDPNYFEDLTDIPKADQSLGDILNERFTLKDLIVKDKIPNEGKSLKTIILNMEDEVLANAGVDVFEEVFKLIFTKLYDEMESADDRVDIETQFKLIKKKNPTLTDKQILEEIDNEDYRKLEFRSRGDAHHTKQVINELYQKAKDKWQGIFEKGEPLRITDENHLQICVGFLQNVKLFNSNLQVIDEAFEYLVNKSAKGEKGQYFTPRNVIDMCVYMMNPKPNEYMIDTACGSCGFTVHTLFNVWQKLVNQGKAQFANFSNQKLTSEQKDYVNKVFGIDFDEKSVRVARTLNMIAGDGKTNVLHLNTLDYTRWEEKLKDSSWAKTYLDGYYRLLDLATNRQNPKEFSFDILMANPPFAGDIKDSRLISNYEVAFDSKGKKANKVSRDILFIERNLDFIKPGGRMAIVLPQGRFNNSSDERIRNFIMEKARLVAVVGLDGNTFKPHTGTKTSVLFVQKWDEKTNPRVDDYEVFMAVSEGSGKNNSGEEIYETNEKGERRLDEHNHLIQKHDLKKIAESFEKWAKEQRLSFWK